jgi:hypothetical protein
VLFELPPLHILDQFLLGSRASFIFGACVEQLYVLVEIAILLFELSGRMVVVWRHLDGHSAPELTLVLLLGLVNIRLEAQQFVRLGLLRLLGQELDRHR